MLLFRCLFYSFYLGCPRKWHFGIPRNTEVISGSIPAKFRGIPRNFAEFRRNWAEITSEVKKFRGIPCRRNSVDTLILPCTDPPPPPPTPRVSRPPHILPSKHQAVPLIYRYHIFPLPIFDSFLIQDFPLIVVPKTTVLHTVTITLH